MEARGGGDQKPTALPAVNRLSSHAEIFVPLQMLSEISKWPV